jgi:hypothetical protein
MTYEKSRATWNSGFRGYKWPITQRLQNLSIKQFVDKICTPENIARADAAQKWEDEQERNMFKKSTNNIGYH